MDEKLGIVGIFFLSIALSLRVKPRGMLAASVVASCLCAGSAQAIWGGCADPIHQYSNVVMVGPGCSGVLLHPRLVLYSAHCGTAYSDIVIVTAAGPRPIPVVFCTAHPHARRHRQNDVAFCKLSREAESLVLVPLLSAKEGNELRAGQRVVISGFGQRRDGDQEQVRTYALSKVSRVLDGLIEIGDEKASPCAGDSGGPALVSAKDGSRRVFGILSYAFSPRCDGAPGVYVPIWNQVQWLEDQSGLDLRPCEDPSGEWSETSRCRHRFPLTLRERAAQE